MKSNMNREIKPIPVDELDEHPLALGFWPDSEARRESVASISESIKLLGVRTPLKVCRKPDGDGYFVIDGCTRLSAARKAGISEIPCHVVDISEEDVGDEVYVANMDRTRFNTGMRVIKYLERHLNEVLAAAKENSDPHKTGSKGGRGNKGGPGETAFSAVSASKRLGICKEDILGGVELVRCKYEGLIVRKVGRVREYVKADETEKEAVEKCYLAAQEGGSLRRWLPSVKGHLATEGKAKKPANYAVIGPDSLVTLKNTFIAWQTLAYIDRERVLEKLSSALESAPDDVTEMLRKRYAETVKKAK